jgi:hypothetical protein
MSRVGFADWVLATIVLLRQGMAFFHVSIDIE